MLANTNKNVIANFAGGIVSGLLVFICTPLYLQYLGMESYALIGLFVPFVALATLLDLGMSTTIMREMARLGAGEHTSNSIHDLQRSFELITFFLISLVITTAWFQSDNLAENIINAQELTDERISKSLFLLICGVALRIYEGLYRGGLYGLKYQVWFNIVHSVMQIFRYVGVLFIFEYYTSSIEFFFIWQIIISLSSILIYRLKLNLILPLKKRSPRFSFDAIQKIAGFAQGMFLLTITHILWKQVDQFLLVSLLPLEEYGQFSLAMTLGSALIIAISPVTQAYYPKLVELLSRNYNDELRKNYNSMSQTITFFISSAGLMMFFYSEEIVFIWTGDAAISQTIETLVSLLAISSILIAQLYGPYNYFIARGNTIFPVLLNSSCLVIIIPMIFILAPRYGAIGVIILKIIADLFRMFFYGLAMKKIITDFNLLESFGFNFLLPFSGSLFVIATSTLLDIEPYSHSLFFILYMAIVFLISSLASLMLANNLRLELSSFMQKINFNMKK